MLGFVGGCSFEQSASGSSKEEAKESDDKQPEARTLVVVETPRRDVIREAVTLNGDLEALDRIELTATISERVRALHVKEGDAVKAGALLVEFDDRPQRFALQEAEQAHLEATENSASAALDEQESRHNEELKKLAFDKAEREYARLEKVLENARQKALTQEEIERKLHARDDSRLQWEVAKTARERAAVTTRLRKLAEDQAKIAVERKRYERSQTEIRSPLDGVVSLLEVRPGEFVSNGAVVAVIVNSRQLFTDVRLPQRTLPLLAPGKPVVIKTEVYPGVEFSGRVDVVHPTVDATEGTIKVRVVVDPDARLRPGMYASASLDLIVHENALLVPKRARLFDNDQSVLFVVRDGRAVRVPITVGLQNSRELEVLPLPVPGSDVLLLESDRVVVRGQSQLKDGMGVIVEGDPETPATPPAANAAAKAGEKATHDAADDATVGGAEG